MTYFSANHSSRTTSRSASFGTRGEIQTGMKLVKDYKNSLVWRNGGGGGGGAVGKRRCPSSGSTNTKVVIFRWDFLTVTKCYPCEQLCIKGFWSQTQIGACKVKLWIVMCTSGGSRIFLSGENLLFYHFFCRKLHEYMSTVSVADLGFPRWWNQLLMSGENLLFHQICAAKMHEIQRNWTKRGAWIRTKFLQFTIFL